MHIKAPQPIPLTDAPSVFLAGSIEQGTAEKWQDKVAEKFLRWDFLVLNPRRDDWDSSWKESIDNPQFKEQVIWELHGLAWCDYILMYFDPNTKSPISLLELGLFGIPDNEHMVVVCPEGFWKKGNVDIVCQVYNIKQFKNLELAIDFIINKSFEN